MADPVRHRAPRRVLRRQPRQDHPGHDRERIEPRGRVRHAHALVRRGEQADSDARQPPRCREQRHLPDGREHVEDDVHDDPRRDHRDEVISAHTRSPSRGAAFAVAPLLFCGEGSRSLASDGGMSLEHLSLAFESLRDAYRAGTATPHAVVDEVLARIERDRERIQHVWLHVDARTTSTPPSIAPRRAATPARPCRSSASPSPSRTTSTSPACRPPWRAPTSRTFRRRSAPVVQRLVEAGAIFVGKVNLDQLATGLVGARSPYGTPTNPFDPRMIPAARARGRASRWPRATSSFALGTDTAGSGRVPAGFNNVVGLKPTRGALSTRGVVPACRSFDCVTVFALTVGDACAVAEVAKAWDEHDPFSRADAQAIDSAQARPTRGEGGASACRRASSSSSSTTRRRGRCSTPRRSALRAMGCDARRGRPAAVSRRGRDALRAGLRRRAPRRGGRAARAQPRGARARRPRHPRRREEGPGARRLRGPLRASPLRQWCDATWRTSTPCSCRRRRPSTGSRRSGESARAQLEPRRLHDLREPRWTWRPSPCPRASAPTACRRACSSSVHAAATATLAAVASAYHAAASADTLGATGHPLTRSPRPRRGSAHVAPRAAARGRRRRRAPERAAPQPPARRPGRHRSCARAPRPRGTGSTRPARCRRSRGSSACARAARHRGRGVVARHPGLRRVRQRDAPPCASGSIELDDGTFAQGFLCESDAVADAEDISDHGGWRALDLRALGRGAPLGAIARSPRAQTAKCDRGGAKGQKRDSKTVVGRYHGDVKFLLPIAFVFAFGCSKDSPDSSSAAAPGPAASSSANAAAPRRRARREDAVARRLQRLARMDGVRGRHPEGLVQGGRRRRRVLVGRLRRHRSTTSRPARSTRSWSRTATRS